MIDQPEPPGKRKRGDWGSQTMEARVKRSITLLGIMALAALMLTQTAAAHKPHRSPSVLTDLNAREKFQLRVIKHDRDVIRFFKNHRFLLNANSSSARTARKELRFHRAQLNWTASELRETRASLRKAAERKALSSASSAAWSWYKSSATQCVANHEGGWSSVNSVGYYGRFQMDVSFQNETAYGRAAYARYGTANNWPAEVQVQHAYSIWKYAGWSRWPTYAKYCS